MTTVLPPVMTTTAQVSSVPVSPAHDPSACRVVFSLAAADLCPDNVVFVETQVAFDNGSQGQLSHVVSVTRQLIRAASATDTTGVPVTQPVTDDVGPGEWSSVFSLMGVDSAIPAGDYYYNVVMGAVSAQATGGETLTIPPGYGDLSILVMNRQTSGGQ